MTLKQKLKGEIEKLEAYKKECIEQRKLGFSRFDEVKLKTHKSYLSTIKSFLKGKAIIEKTEWLDQFMKAHNLKTYQEAIDKLINCYRVWTTQIRLKQAVAGDYKLVKKTTIQGEGIECGV